MNQRTMREFGVNSVSGNDFEKRVFACPSTEFCLTIKILASEFLSTLSPNARAHYRENGQKKQ